MFKFLQKIVIYLYMFEYIKYTLFMLYAWSMHHLTKLYNPNFLDEIYIIDTITYKYKQISFLKLYYYILTCKKYYVIFTKGRMHYIRYMKLYKLLSTTLLDKNKYSSLDMANENKITAATEVLSRILKKTANNMINIKLHTENDVINHKISLDIECKNMWHKKKHETDGSYLLFYCVYYKTKLSNNIRDLIDSNYMLNVMNISIAQTL